MAKRVLLVDDISGDVIDEGLGGTVEFSFDGKHYTIDLGVKNRDAFRKDMTKWTEHAQEVEAPRRQTTTRRRTASSASSGMSKETREAIRHWANSNGYSVGDRGRIKAEIVEAFEASQRELVEENKNTVQ